jgi:hypothetical protein
MFAHAKASTKNMGVFISIVEDTNHDEGQSLCIHSIHPFQTVMGQPSEWDKHTFGFVNDVLGRYIQSIEVIESMFAQTRRAISTCVHRPVANANQTWASNPALKLVPFIPNEEPGSVFS